MPHIALARKYRPRRFADVATQDLVAETLRRSVSTGRLGPAYLFCGPRGVGKTTVARVLAMALNCSLRNPEGEPCTTCESCLRIWNGQTSLDVVEIDAASNRGVEDARALRESASYAPTTEGRWKVYIVDEAHMLTREAWNALLKILEEPPPRVVFVFATTEPQKIQQAAAPILSRCQRFDFRRIGQTDIVSRLHRVLAEEGIDAPEEALRLIARKADGGMRDALSLLDQVLALGGGEISGEGTRRALGVIGEERMLELVSLIRERRIAHLLGFVETLLDEGYDLSEFHHGLVDAIRRLLLLRVDPDAPAEGWSAPVWEAFRNQAADFDAADLVRMLGLASELETSGALRRASQPRLHLELLLMRLAYLDRTVDLETLLRALGGEASLPRPFPDPDPRRTSGPSSSSSGPSGAAPGGPAPEVRGERGSPDAPGPVGSAGDPGAVRSQPGPVEPPSRTEADAPTGEARWNRFLGTGREPLPERTAPLRITPDAVREDRMQGLLAQEPLLREAVEELDLELLD